MGTAGGDRSEELTYYEQYGSRLVLKYLQVRMEEVEWRKLMHAAVEAGKTLSDYIRERLGLPALQRKRGGK